MNKRPRTPFRGDPPMRAVERIQERRALRRQQAALRLKAYSLDIASDLHWWRTGETCTWRMSEWRKTPRQLLQARHKKRRHLAAERLIPIDELIPW